MEFLKPALLFMALSCAVLATSFLYVWVTYGRRRYALYWGLAWLVAVPHLACNWLMVGAPNAPLLEIIDQLLLVANASLMVCGCYAFAFGRIPLGRISALALPFIAWGVFAPLQTAEFARTQIPDAILLGGSYLWTAGTFLNLYRAKHTRGTLVIALLFALAGLHELDYPLFGDVAWAAPVGYTIASMLAMSIAVSLLILILEESRIEVDQERARLYGVLDALPVGVLMLDPAGSLVLDNRAARALLGDATAEAPITMAALATRLLPPGDDSAVEPAAEAPMLRSLRSGETCPPEEFALLDGTGVRHSVLVNAGPVRDANTSLLGVVTVLQDVEAWKQIERQMVRTQRLQALGTLASGVAHNFNNNLALILGHAQLALQAATGAPERVRLNAICQIATDSVGIVSRIQDLARARPSGVRSVTVFDLGALVHDVIELSRPRWRDDADAAGIHYVVDTGLESDVLVAGQPGDLREAILNLVINALDAMPAGGRLSVSVSADAAEACLRLTDDGQGMPTEIRERIFDPFFSTKGVRGTGLGLSLVFGVVERHAGRIAVDSAPGTGTTFTLHFPLAAGALPQSPALGGTSASSLHMLVVDDDAALRAMTVEMLVAAGYRATPAQSPQLALQMLEDVQFDLVFTDLAMPGVTGWEIAAHAARMRPGMPVVLVTGWGQTITAEDCAMHGTVSVLPKPFTLSQLRVAVEQATSRLEAAA